MTLGAPLALSPTVWRKLGQQRQALSILLVLYFVSVLLGASLPLAPPLHLAMKKLLLGNLAAGTLLQPLLPTVSQRRPR